MTDDFFQGPVRPGYDVEYFRRTGRSRRLFQGPVRPGYDVEYFRRTGRRRGRRKGQASKRWLELQSLEKARLSALQRQEEARRKAQEEAERQARAEALEMGVGEVKEPKQTFLQRQVRGLSSIGAEVGAPSFIGIGPWGIRPPASVKFQEGITYEFIPKTKEELISYALLGGAGYGVGFGLRGGGALVTRFAPKATPFVETGVKIGGGALLGYFGYEKGKEFVVAPTPEAKGGVIGETAGELLAFGGGAWLGGKSAGKLIGWTRTRGLLEIPAEDVIAPEYFRGQRFPAIRRGQTAGELRSEFFEPVLSGEMKGVSLFYLEK